jgi:hypothetical protein
LGEFKRRKLSHYRDSCGWEYIIRDKEGVYFGVRGNSIKMETFSRVFSDEKKYYMNEKIAQNWHYNEQQNRVPWET